MIDMHCHLLPGVDDGVQEMNEAINQIAQAIEFGVTDIIITPHYRPTKEFVQSTLELQNIFQKLKERVQKEKLDVNLYLGREIDEVKNVKELLDNKTVSSFLNNAYLLIDFGVNKANIEEYIYETKILGYKVVVAHVERYKYVETLEQFQHIKKEGALIQINASSIISPRNKTMRKKVRILLKNKLVDFVATDAHRNPDSYKYFRKAYSIVSKKYGKEYADVIFNENQKMLISS